MIKILASVVLVVFALAQSQSQQPPEYPPFLANAGAAKQREFAVWLQALGPGLPPNVFENQVKSWVSRQNPSIQAAFAKFNADMLNAKKAHEAAAARFSPAAKAAHLKMQAIEKNPSIAPQQKFQQIDQIMQSLPPNVRDEIMKSFQG